MQNNSTNFEYVELLIWLGNLHGYSSATVAATPFMPLFVLASVTIYHAVPTPTYPSLLPSPSRLYARLRVTTLLVRVCMSFVPICQCVRVAQA
ncbi:hypothetical protein Scep_002103 [Stephania cephalantha]|uniref:Uncharacterized protein n=1 Tax=Stephania cephalantha TaxID=152367 RepID=A0AAP0Q404_9MAGN